MKASQMRSINAAGGVMYLTTTITDEGFLKKSTSFGIKCSYSKKWSPARCASRMQKYKLSYFRYSQAVAAPEGKFSPEMKLLVIG